MHVFGRAGLVASFAPGLFGLMMQVAPSEAAKNLCQWVQASSCLDWAGQIPPAAPWVLYGVSVLAISWVLWPLTKRWWPNTHSPDVPLSTLSNKVLCAKAVAFANGMRAFEAEHQRTEQTVSAHEWTLNATSTGMSADDRQKRWAASHNASAELRAQFEAEFKTKYRPDAIALRNEITSRLTALGFDLKSNDHNAMVFDDGMLAGVNAVARASDYLDEIARKLPNVSR